MKQGLSYCGQVVRENDPDRFLLSMFAPADPPSSNGLRRDIGRREALWALFAFNHEIAKTREVVSETSLGLARLQWWREAIGKIYDSPSPDGYGAAGGGHEVLKALAPAIKTYGLARDYFDTLIYAREFDLENICPASLEGFLKYADFTTTPLMSLALQICGDEPDMDPVPAVAVNYAMAGLLRAVPFHASQRRCYLPEDLMQKHNVTLTNLFDFLKPGEGMKEVVREVAGQFVPGIHPSSRLLRATQGLAGIYMGQIRRRGYDVYSRKMLISPAFKELRLATAAGF